jgi:cytosine/adenosine deaminase-related metal-dependent hydrolase
MALNLVRAPWVLPVAAPPIADGAVVFEGATVRAVGRYEDVARTHCDRVVDLDGCVLLPGLVNAHTHLEWSFARGLIAPQPCFSNWLTRLGSLRDRWRSPEALQAVAPALEGMSTAGTVAVGDVATYLATAPFIEASKLVGTVFHEVLGLGPEWLDRTFVSAYERCSGPDSTDVHRWLGCHAPYSVAPEGFTRAVEWVRSRGARLSVHVAESQEEVELLREGDGALRRLYESWDFWEPSWRAPECSPVAYMESLGVLGPHLVAVHVVQLTVDDIGVLASHGVTCCLCPLSNDWVGMGRPRAASLARAGIALALGTDSLASNSDLDVRGEMRAITEGPEALSSKQALRAATLGGACALGWGGILGSLEIGKRPGALAFPLDGCREPHEAVIAAEGPPVILVNAEVPHS